jgi:hypothetical protein
MRLIIGRGFQDGVALTSTVKASVLRALPEMAELVVEDFGGDFSRVLVPIYLVTYENVSSLVAAIERVAGQEVTAKLEILPSRVNSLSEWTAAFRWLLAR